MNQEDNTAQYHVQDNSNVEAKKVSAAIKQYEQKKYKEALNLFIGALNTNADAELYINIGNCHYMMENQKEAVDYWNKAIDLDPKNSKAYANLGNLYYKNNDIEKAISFWLVSLVTTPEDGNICLNLAIAFNQKEMRFESIKYFEKYIK